MAYGPCPQPRGACRFPPPTTEEESGRAAGQGSSGMEYGDSKETAMTNVTTTGQTSQVSTTDGTRRTHRPSGFEDIAAEVAATGEPHHDRREGAMTTQELDLTKVQAFAG